MILFSQVVLPDPPEWLVAHALHAIDNRPIMNVWGPTYASRTIKHESGEYQSSNNKVIFLDEDALAWTKENIDSEVKDIRVFSSTVGRHMTGPHTDMTRNYTLQYLLQGGGPYHATGFYKEKGKDLHILGRHSVSDFSLLDPLAQIHMPLRAWTLLNSKVLHSAEWIDQGRISLQVNLDAIPASFADKLKHTISVSNY
jgi:hypothetical protein